MMGTKQEWEMHEKKRHWESSRWWGKEGSKEGRIRDAGKSRIWRKKQMKKKRKLREEELKRKTCMLIWTSFRSNYFLVTWR